MKKYLTLLLILFALPAWGFLFPSKKAKNYSNSLLDGTLFIHLEESRLANGIDVENTLELAKSAGKKVSLALDNFAVIDKYRERIWALLETYTDVLYVTPEEAYALTQLPPDLALPFLKNFCRTVIVKE